MTAQKLQEGDDRIYDWSQAIATGREDIDDQHRQLFAYIKQLREMSLGKNQASELESVINGLKNYTVEHFSYEESIMDGFDYNQKDRHKAAHTSFINKINKFDCGKLSDSNIALDLIDFLYDWLVTHITTIDRMMIAKLNRDHHDMFAEDTSSKQTRAVVDGAFQAAGQVERISARLGSAPAARRNLLRSQLSDASERLMNLIYLAQVRVERFGCAPTDLSRLQGINGAVAASAQALLQSAVKDLIEYGANIVAGRHGIPFGVGAALTHRLEAIATLLHVAGGMAGLDEELRDEVAQATEIVNEVVTVEAGVMAMPNFALDAVDQASQAKVGSVGNNHDYVFIRLVQRAAADITQLLEAALDGDLISVSALFDENYQPILGSNPPQFTTKFLDLAERLFPAILEATQHHSTLINFAVAVDRNGYLPVHHPEYSQPQGSDPVWNTANCRNRRLFNDRTGLAAARNQATILLQTYLRDMGGGEVHVMRDASAPILVKGRHWGALRIGYQMR